MTATLLQIGRIIALIPASLGEEFKNDCAVTIRTVDRPCYANGWQKLEKFTTNRLWWEQTDSITGETAFCTLAGYEARILSGLKKRGIEVTTQSRVDSGLGRPDFSKIAGVALRDKQKEMLIKSATTNVGLFDLATGSGKTFFIKVLAAVYPEAHIVITVPSIDVARDIYSGLCTGDLIDPKEIGFVGDGERNPRRITVAVTQSIHHCNANANLLLIDEAHMCLTASYITAINNFTRARLLAFTATPEGKSDGSDGYLEAIAGPVLVESDYQTSVEAGSIVQLKVMKVYSPKGPDVSGIEQDHAREQLGIIRNIDRNELIAKTVKNMQALLGDSAQILVMVDKTEHAYRLQQLLRDFVVVCSDITTERLEKLAKLGAYDPGWQRACLPKDRAKYKAAFEANTLKLAIATGVWERGVDFKDLACLVRADAMASPIKSGQIPGRLSRLGADGKKQFGILVDFFDTFSRDLKAKAVRRFKVYKDNGWEIMDE